MSRTGVLWSTGAIRVVQEHFITNLIYRKICVAVDNQFVEITEKSKRFALFLPEGETHELLLRFTEYLLRKNNHHVTYIGTSLPFDELDFIARKFKPDYLVTYITLPLNDITIDSYLTQLAKSFSNTKIIVGGAQLTNLTTTKLKGHIIPVNSASELMSAIA